MPKPQPAPDNAGQASSRPPLAGADIGVNLMVSVLVAGGMGYALDAWLGWAPWGMLVGGALGFAAWLRMVWRGMQR